MSQYQGSELELFQHAVNWKEYYSNLLRPYIKGNVLEVGAGIGETTRFLYGTADHWICLEPDPRLTGIIRKKTAEGQLDSSIQVLNGFITDIEPASQFDTIIYIDVVEHIEDHENEIKQALQRLKPGGHLIILVPAIQYIFNEFDKAIGHYRRYNKKLLSSIMPSGLVEVELRYLDSAGLLASLVNKFVLRQPYPTKKQILFWDKFLVSLSKISDPVSFYTFGKSLFGVWKKTGG